MFEQKKKILIIDDDNAFRDIVAFHLGQYYDITQAANGEIGFKSALECKPDLILLDLQLPDIYGFGVLEKIRSCPDQSIANTKVIIFSNQTNEQDRLRAKELSVTEYLVKSNTDINYLKKVVSEIFK